MDMKPCSLLPDISPVTGKVPVTASYFRIQRFRVKIVRYNTDSIFIDGLKVIQ